MHASAKDGSGSIAPRAAGGKRLGKAHAFFTWFYIV